MNIFPLTTNQFSDLETLKMNFLWSEKPVGHNEWQWEGTDKPSNFARSKRGEFKTLYDENSFTYKVNSHFFRCPEFGELDFTKPIFAVGGCSVTFGIGVPYEHTWGYLIWQKLKEEFPDTQYVNLAIGGTSIDFSTRALSCFGDNVKYFDCYVNLLTEPSRRELSLEKSFFFPFLHFTGQNFFHDDPSVQHALHEYSRTFALDNFWTKYNLNRNMVMFDLTSRLHNVPMILDFWSFEENHSETYPENLVEPQFKQYFVNGYDTRFYAPVDPSIPEELLNARDEYHPGKFYHQRYADNLYPLAREKFISSLKTKKS